MPHFVTFAVAIRPAAGLGHYLFCAIRPAVSLITQLSNTLV